MKKEDHTIFFTLLDSFGSDAHEREEPSDDFSRRIKFLMKVIGEVTKMQCIG